MFALWCVGDKEKGIGPFKNFDRQDMPTLATKKRLSDVNNLMDRLEKKLKEERRWIANPSIAQVNAMYGSAAGVLEVLEVAEATMKGLKRRIGQLKWNSHLDLLRSKRVAREEAESDSDDV